MRRGGEKVWARPSEALDVYDTPRYLLVNSVLLLVIIPRLEGRGDASANDKLCGCGRRLRPRGREQLGLAGGWQYSRRRQISPLKPIR